MRMNDAMVLMNDALVRMNAALVRMNDSLVRTRGHRDPIKLKKNGAHVEARRSWDLGS
jgi:hypothetical protein